MPSILPKCTLGPLSPAVAPLSIHSAVTVSVYYCGFWKFMSGPFLGARCRSSAFALRRILLPSHPYRPTGTVSFISLVP